MVKINFTVPNAREMILSGRKKSTIRQLSVEKEDQIRRHVILQLYEGSWRTGNQVKIADAQTVDLRPIYEPLGHFIDNIFPELLYSEGFETKEEMKGFFVKQYGPDILQECTFSLIEFRTVDLQERAAQYDAFDYTTMYEYETGEAVFLGSKKKYPNHMDFLNALQEKEHFVIEEGEGVIEYAWVNYGAYLDGDGDECNGWNYTDGSGEWDDPNGLPVWLVRHEYGTFSNAAGGA